MENTGRVQKNRRNEGKYQLNVTLKYNTSILFIKET